MEMATFKFSRIFNDDIGALGNAKCESVEWQTQDSIRYCRQSLFRYEMASSSSSHTIARRFDDPHFNALFALSTRLVFPLRPVGRWRGKMKNFQMANFYRSFLFILTLGSRIFRRWGWTRDICRGWRRRKTLKKSIVPIIIKTFRISISVLFWLWRRGKTFLLPPTRAKIFTLRLCDDIHPPLAAAAARTTLITNNNSLPLLSPLPVDFRFYILLRASSTSQHTAQALSYFSYHLIIIAVCTIASFQIHITRWTCRECSTTYVDVIFD